MENRLAKLKLDDTLNEDSVKDKTMEIERECVSSVMFKSYNVASICL